MGGYYSFFEYESGFCLSKGGMTGVGGENMFLVIVLVFAMEVFLLMICIGSGGLLFFFMGCSFFFLETILSLGSGYMKMFLFL